MRIPSDFLLGILLLSLPCAGPALPREEAFHHYIRRNWSVKDGLPQSSVTAVAQDRVGCIWIGTQAGLARFDGVKFVRYAPDTEPNLPGIWIRSLYLASDSKFWIGTYKGLTVYDGTSFTPVPVADTKRWPALDIHELGEDAAGQIWAATSDGVFRAKAGRLHKVPGSPSSALANSNVCAARCF